MSARSGARDEWGHGSTVDEPMAQGMERLEALFVAQARKTPDAIALVCGARRLSYRELDGRANQFAGLLASRGIGAGARIALGLSRQPDLVAALIGILKLNATVVPLDPAYPPERLCYMLEHSGAEGVLVGGAEEWAAEPAAEVGDARTRPLIALDRDGAALEDQSIAPRPPVSGAGHPAFILYTSGSTGRPKGVLLAHAASLYIRAALAIHTAEELARVAAVTSICFDPAIFEIFAPLASGNTIILKQSALEPFTDEEAPTLLQNVPSVLFKLAQAGALPASLRAINSGGEALTQEAVRAIYAGSSIDRLFNHYGPTEATICTTIALVPRDPPARPDVGHPVAHATVAIRDGEGRPLPNGQSGEVLIGGPGLALGYLDEPGLTAERFVTDRTTGQRMYRTGDLGRLLESGALEILGREDDQVKIRGNRVELGEIDDALLGLDGIREAAAVAVPRDDGSQVIIAHLVARHEQPRTELVAALQHRLPSFMMPGGFRFVEALPRMPGGKIDRARLVAQAAGEAPRPPDEDGSLLAGPEEVIAAIFAATLGRESFGLDEDFFDAGGDSLQGVDVALAVARALGEEVAPNLIVHFPTPRRFADAMSEDGPWDLALTEEGTPDGPALVFAPGIGGGPYEYSGMVRHLRGYRLIYLFSEPMIEDLRRSPRVEIITERLMAELLEAAPEEPLTLIGYSYAGVIAFDLAHRLRSAGRGCHLVLVDPLIGRTGANAGQWRAWMRDAVLPGVRRFGLAASLGAALRGIRHWMPRTIGRFFPVDLPAHVEASEVAFVTSLIRAQARYRFHPYAGETLLILARQASERALFLNPDGLGGWGGLLSGSHRVEWVEAPHDAILRKNHAGGIAAMVRKIAGAPGAAMRPPRHEPEGGATRSGSGTGENAGSRAGTVGGGC